MELMGVKAEEIRATALYYKTFWLRVAVVVRGIVKGHLFNGGNKRTRFDTVRLFQARNTVVMRDIAMGRLAEVEQIAARLRGFSLY